MTSSIHALVQDTNNSNPVAGRLKVDNMLLDAAPSIARSDVGTALRLLRCFSQIGTGGFNKVSVAHCLGQAPICYGIIEHPIKVALRPWGEPTFSHAARLCAA